MLKAAAWLARYAYIWPTALTTDDDDRMRWLVILGSACDRFGVRCLVYCHPPRSSIMRKTTATRALESLFTSAADSLSRDLAMAEAFLRYAYTLREIAAATGSKPATVWLVVF